MRAQEILDDIMLISEKHLSKNSQNKYMYTIKKILDVIDDDFNNLYDYEDVTKELEEYYSFNSYVFSIRMICEMLKTQYEDHQELYDIYDELKSSLLKLRKNK